LNACPPARGLGETNWQPTGGRIEWSTSCFTREKKTHIARKQAQSLLSFSSRSSDFSAVRRSDFQL
jgi:hypothetical protein